MEARGHGCAKLMDWKALMSYASQCMLNKHLTGQQSQTTNTNAHTQTHTLTSTFMNNTKWGLM